MEWLNYHHLYYFYVVAREGSIVRARKELRLAQPTISAQIKALEDALDTQLFERVGRSLVLTDTGQLVYRYAETIFSAGRELMDVVKGRAPEQVSELPVGIVDVLPKSIVYRVLKPVLEMPASRMRLACREDTMDTLVYELTRHRISLILSDAPINSSSSPRLVNEQLGVCGVSFLGRGREAARYATGFPASLNGAPLLLPMHGTSLRRSLDTWFHSKGITPEVIGEFDDNALATMFGQAGFGIFVVPSIVEDEMRRQYSVDLVGRTDDIREHLYAISMERTSRHPAVARIIEAARTELFRPTRRANE